MDSQPKRGHGRLLTDQFACRAGGGYGGEQVGECALTALRTVRGTGE